METQNPTYNKELGYMEVDKYGKTPKDGPDVCISSGDRIDNLAIDSLVSLSPVKDKEYRTAEQIERLIRLLDPMTTSAAMSVIQRNIGNVSEFMSDPYEARNLMDNAKFEENRIIASQTVDTIIDCSEKIKSNLNKLYNYITSLKYKVKDSEVLIALDESIKNMEKIKKCQHEYKASPKVRVSASPKARVSASPKARVSASPKARVSASPKARVSASPKARVSVSPKVRVSVSPKARVSASPKDRI